MANFGLIYRSIWNKPRFSLMSNDAKLMLLYIFSSPHGNTLGLFVLKKFYAVEDLGWGEDIGRINTAIDELKVNGWIGYDEKTSLLLINRFFDFNKVYNKDHFKKVQNDISNLPSSFLFGDMLKQITDDPGKISPQYIEPFKQILGNCNRTYVDNRDHACNHACQDMCGHAVEVDLHVNNDIIETKSGSESDPGNSEGKSGIRVPFKKLIELYNDCCKSCITAIGYPSERKRILKARFKEHPYLKWWQDYFIRIESSDFLTGRKRPPNGNYNGWKPDFDWLIKPDNMVKILEGKYDNRGDAQPQYSPEEAGRILNEHREALENAQGSLDPQFKT